MTKNMFMFSISYENRYSQYLKETAQEGVSVKHPEHLF